MRRVIWLLVCFLLAGSLGFGIGVAVPLYRDSRHRDLSQYSPEDRKFIETFQLMVRMKWADERATHTLEDPQKKTEERRQSLLDELQSIAETQRQVHPPELDSLIEAQAGVANLRLAFFEEADGKAQAAKTYLTKAQDYLKQAGWQDYSESNLRSMMQARPGTGSGKANGE